MFSLWNKVVFSKRHKDLNLLKCCWKHCFLRVSYARAHAEPRVWRHKSMTAAIYSDQLRAERSNNQLSLTISWHLQLTFTRLRHIVEQPASAELKRSWNWSLRSRTLLEIPVRWDTGIHLQLKECTVDL